MPDGGPLDGTELRHEHAPRSPIRAGLLGFGATVAVFGLDRWLAGALDDEFVSAVLTLTTVTVMLWLIAPSMGSAR